MADLTVDLKAVQSDDMKAEMKGVTTVVMWAAMLVESRDELWVVRLV